jgi:hypothetical protein
MEGKEAAPIVVQQPQAFVQFAQFIEVQEQGEHAVFQSVRPGAVAPVYDPAVIDR